MGDAAQVDVRMERRNLFLKGLSKKCELYPKAPVESLKDIKQMSDMIKFDIWKEHYNRMWRIRGRENL